MRTEAAEAVRAFLSEHPTEDTVDKYTAPSLLEAFFRALETKYRWDKVKIGTAWVSLDNLLQGVAGYKVARGETSVTGTADIATGLATLVQCVAVLKDDVSLDGAWVSVADSVTAGNVVLKVWKPTAAADCTPIAAIVAKSVRWVAMGT